MAGKLLGIAYAGELPLSVRLAISQSRNCPRPPSPMLPAPTPPNGNEIIASCAPEKTRGYGLAGGATAAVCASTGTALASATDCRNPRRRMPLCWLIRVDRTTNAAGARGSVE